MECFTHGRQGIAGTRREQALAQIGIGRQTLIARSRSEIAQLAPHRMGGEWMDGGLEPHDHADRPAADLRIGLAARGAHAMDVGQRVSPQLGLGIDLDQQAGKRAARQRRRRFQRLELAGAEVGVHLDHAAAGAFDTLRNAQQLGLAGRQRGREASVAGLVLGRPRGREAHGAGAQRLLGEARHLLDFALGRHFGVLGAAVAHDIEA